MENKKGVGVDVVITNNFKFPKPSLRGGLRHSPWLVGMVLDNRADKACRGIRVACSQPTSRT